MATPYCSRDQWSVRKSSKTQAYGNWADYAAAEAWPDATSLDKALSDATNIMNNPAHINTTSNLTDGNYTEWLERLCYDMANRILGVEGNQAMQGGIWTYSPGDKMNRYERQTIISLSKIKSKRRVGRVVF